LEQALQKAGQSTREATMLRITRYDNPAPGTHQLEDNRPSRMALVGPAAFAALAAAFVWLALRAENDRGWLVALSAVAFALTAGLGFWHSHARAARRLNAALDAYAGQEIVRARRWKELARTQRESRQERAPISPMSRPSAQEA
jgi:hypothetical protein